MTMSGAGRRWTVRPAIFCADDDGEPAGVGIFPRQIPGRLWPLPRLAVGPCFLGESRPPSGLVALVPKLLTVNSLFYRGAARKKAKNGQFCSAEGLALVF